MSYATFKELSYTGMQDLCFYNFKCDGRVGTLHAFNNIWSNIGYFLLGILFFLITVVKNISLLREVRAEGVRTPGIPQTFGIYYSISFAMFFEGFLSSIYHLCPTLTNLQFDTTFIYIMLTLLFVKYYKNRHPDSNFRPFSVF